MADADDSLLHLRKMKRRLGSSSADIPMEDKVDLLEKTISVFRSEVDMKLRIMHQILTTRNEQVSVHKKLLEREQCLYDTLLGHWKNAANLAANGVSVNFSADEILNDYGGDENNSDPDYVLGDDPGPSRKKSKSSLRRQRNSRKSGRGQRPAQNAGLSGTSQSSFDVQDPLSHSGPADSDWSVNDGNGEDIDPRVHVDVKCETQTEDGNGTDNEEDGKFEETFGAGSSRVDYPVYNPDGTPVNFEKFISTYKKKITYKIAGGGYTYSKRNTTNGSEYYQCDQRSICCASIIHKNGMFISGRKHWMQGTHLAHPPDFERSLKKTTFTKRKSKMLAKQYPEILVATETFLNHPLDDPKFGETDTDPAGLPLDSEDNNGASSSAPNVTGTSLPNPAPLDVVSLTPAQREEIMQPRRITEISHQYHQPTVQTAPTPLPWNSIQDAHRR